ncbi:MAG: hypothetical protein RBU37_26215, partial [Myxococcota bacterium]|nr:hypothetical protein [Myxococcota bacterium]
SDGWDGRDELGELVAPNRAYSLEVEVMVARFWTGKGNGPGCGPEDLQEALRIGASPGVFERISALPACCVSVRPLVRTVLNWMLAKVVASIPEWDPMLMCAPDCNRAEIACRLTVLDTVNPYKSEDDQGACGECRILCLSNCTSAIKDCIWPNGPTQAPRPVYDTCMYWTKNLKSAPVPLPFEAMKSKAICFEERVEYVECQADSLIPTRDTCQPEAAWEYSSCAFCQYSCNGKLQGRFYPPTTLHCPPTDIFPIYPD